MSINSSIVGALDTVYQERAESQEDRGDIYIKVFFSILNKDRDIFNIDSIECNVAESVVLRDVLGTSAIITDISDKINETIIIDCSDLIVNGDGVCDDTEGQYLKILEAIDELSIIIDRNRLRIPLANVHIAVYGFELIEDTVRGFSYLVDNDNSLFIIDEKLCSLIMELPTFFSELEDYGWFMWIDYIGIFEYYQLCQQLEGHVETYSKREDSSKPDPDGDNEGDKNRVFNLRVTKCDFVYEYESHNWLDTTQLVFDVVGFVPGLSEITSLTNGFIYLGREIHAGVIGDYDKMIEYRNQAVEGFIFAIPGSSILKSSIKFVRAGKAVRNAQRAEELRKNARRARQALNRTRSKKTSRRNCSQAQRRNREAQCNNVSQHTLENAIETRDLRLREGGWTIGELTDTNMNVLRRNYRNIMNTADRILRGDPNIPTTNIDRVIDILERGVDFGKFLNDNALPAY